jgi:NAD(P)H-dependent FMN reductase
MTVPQRSPIRILVFGASLRAESLNVRLAALAAEIVRVNGGTAELAAMHEWDVPVFNGDLEATEGIPAGAERFCHRLESWTDSLSPRPSTTRRCPASSRT